MKYIHLDTILKRVNELDDLADAVRFPDMTDQPELASLLLTLKELQNGLELLRELPEGSDRPMPRRKLAGSIRRRGKKRLHPKTPSATA